MKVGVFMPVGAANADPELLRTAGEAVEERGFESIWMAEHVVLFDDYDSRYPYSPDGRFPGGGDTGLLEPFTALTYLAAVTSRVRLGTGICLVPQRNPVYTAKQVVDLDALSGGRVDFGVGAGWLREEFEALQMPFERRGDRTREHLEVMKALWCDEVSEYHGELYDLRPCRLYPKPVQQPHPPIHVGGESEAALRRVAQLGQGWYTFNRPPEDLAGPLRRLDELLDEHGRTRADITLSVAPYLQPIVPGMVDGYREHGVDRVIGLCLAFDRDMLLASLDQLVTDLLEPAAA
ncbi:MAG TPA: LLM class F420-dependent oxidoreductase [Acidimicrobiia bacterium]